MRPLKFRIPLKCNNCGKLGFDYQEWNGQQFITTHITPCCDKRAYEIVGRPQQFTSISDKNEKEICEGDIVRWQERSSKTGNPDDCKAEVVWTADGFTIKAEIIGNVHENKGLLNES